MLGMRTRRADGLGAKAEDAGSLEAEVSEWRHELSTLGPQRAALQEEATAGGETATAPGPALRAIAALDLRKQRLIWNIRESEQLLRSQRRRPLASSMDGHDATPRCHSPVSLRAT